ncbi:MAG: hypothetical protein R3F02_02230 [Thiolinea sp.]
MIEHAAEANDLIKQLPEDQQCTLRNFFDSLSVELEDAYSIVNVCRMAALSGELGDADSFAGVLFNCSNQLFTLTETLQGMAKGEVSDE